MGAANLVLVMDQVKNGLVPEYLRGWAHASAFTLRLFGENASVHGSAISSPRFQVNIKQGCDALQPTILFVSAVLASPVGFMSKLPGLLAGFSFLMFLNLTRVISLFYIGIYWNSAFETMHHDVWQALFIIFSIAAWAIWAVWAVKRTPLPTLEAP